MNELCREHRNKIHRICLSPNCQQRAMCLLCQHPHGNPFSSIMARTSESYKKFEAVINSAIDCYLLEKEESLGNKVLGEQQRMLKKYFGELRAEVEEFLKETERETLQKLQSEEEANFRTIKRARIHQNYVNLDSDIFQILLQAYQGTPFKEIFTKTEGANSEHAYHHSAKLHYQLTDILTENNFRLKTHLPDIRQLALQEEGERQGGEEGAGEYEAEGVKPRYEVKLVEEAEIGFESIISDCKQVNGLYFAVSYDKTLKVMDEKLSVVGEEEYGNVLTKIKCLGDDVFAMGQSKEIVVESIRWEKSRLQTENILKLRGHTEKIGDLGRLNSRILGSSSSEGVKIWDLYKQRCEYTLREEANPTAIDFIPSANLLLVGYNNHSLKVYSVETMKLVKKYELPGVPLLVDVGKFNENQFYVGGFPSMLGIIDTRMVQMASEFHFKQGALTCATDSLYNQHTVATADREGHCNMLDLRSRKSRVSWTAHSSKSSISKPRGVVGLFEKSQTRWTTFGCNQRNIKVWNIEDVQN